MAKKKHDGTHEAADRADHAEAQSRDQEQFHGDLDAAARELEQAKAQLAAHAGKSAVGGDGPADQSVGESVREIIDRVLALIARLRGR